MLTYLIFDNDRLRNVVDGIETRDGAEATLALLIEEDPEARGDLDIVGMRERERAADGSR